MKTITTAALCDQAEGFLLDAYGVLVNAEGALPGAAAFLNLLAAKQRRYAVVTNDASRSVARLAERFQTLGLPIRTDQIVSSGMLLAPFFAAHSLGGAHTLVLGTADSEEYVRQAGGQVIAVSAQSAPQALAPEVIAVCDDAGLPFLLGCELAMSACMHMIDQGKPPVLLLPNPDIIYPKGQQGFGLTAGAMALMIEAGLARRYGAQAPRFVALGKPAPGLLERGLQATQTTRANTLMIGDQLDTDIAAAHAAGLRSVLIAGTNVRHPDETTQPPTWHLQGF